MRNADNLILPQWELDLSAPPRITYTDMGHHGGREKLGTYCLKNAWCIHVFRYEGMLELDGKKWAIRPGFASLIPPGVVFTHHWFTYPSVHLFAWFELPQTPLPTQISEGARTLPAVVRVPVLQDLGIEAKNYDLAMEEVVRWSHAHPSRAQARLWDLLWRLGMAALSPATLMGLAPSRAGLLRAVQMMQTTMDKSHNITNLARLADVSACHLNRLFLAEFGITPMAYLREIRIERAKVLLNHTSLPIKTIANEVGITDIQFFNKMIRQSTGSSPRKFRLLSKPKLPLS